MNRADFRQETLGRAAPYALYDLVHNRGYTVTLVRKAGGIVWLSLSYRDYLRSGIPQYGLKPFLALVVIQRFNPVCSNIL